MDKVKYFYFTSIIWTIVVLSLIIVFVYKTSEDKVMFTEKLPCSNPDENIRQKCVCSKEFCVNKCCVWGEQPNATYRDSMYRYVCSSYGNQDEQNNTFAKSLQYYYTSTVDAAPKTNRDHTFEIYIDFLTSEPFEHPTDGYLIQTNVDFAQAHLFQNGTILLNPVGDWYLSPSRYCLDTFYDSGETKFKLFFTIPFSSVPDANSNQDYNDTTQSILQKVLISVSEVFFMFTLLVYAVLPRLQTLSVKCLMCYFLSMLTANAGLLYFQWRDVNAEYNEKACYIVGKFIIMYLLFFLLRHFLSYFL